MYAVCMLVRTYTYKHTHMHVIQVYVNAAYTYICMTSYILMHVALYWLSSSFLSCLAIIYVATVYTFFKLYLCYFSNTTIVSLQSLLLKNTVAMSF